MGEIVIYDLVPNTDPILRQKMPKFDFKNPPINPVDLAANLAETMFANKGQGLAANQCGLPYNLFVMANDPLFVCFNAIIVDQSTETVIMKEGCLTFPALVLKIRRPVAVKVRFATPDGEVSTHSFTGMTARCFQHEYDHVNGVLYIDKVTKIELEIARRKQVKLLRRIGDRKSLLR